VLTKRAAVLDALGGEAGCRRLSAEFYARVGRDPVLKPLFPGKTLRCAIEELGAFLIQFLGGDGEQTQKRWQLSLRESHARFRIGGADRSAWLKHMTATIEAAAIGEETRSALMQFFGHSSAYVIGKETAAPEHEELAARWVEQRALDDIVAAIAAGRDDEAIELGARFVGRPEVFAGVLARMIRSGRADLIAYALKGVERDPSLGPQRFGGRPLLHYAAGAGCLEIVEALLRLGTDADVQCAGGHTALYCVGNECGSAAGPDLVRALVVAGADVNARGGVTRTTPLHMAARRGHLEVARTLLDLGAEIGFRDTKGDTPLERAIHCRKDSVARLLRERGAAAR
jgi:hemoglobin